MSSEKPGFRPTLGHISLAGTSSRLLMHSGDRKRAPSTLMQVAQYHLSQDLPRMGFAGATGGSSGRRTHRLHVRKTLLTWEPPYGIEP